MTREQYLEVHKLISEELRHTSTVIWQFAIAIITLQGGAVGLSVQKGFEGILYWFKSVLLLDNLCRIDSRVSWFFVISVFREAIKRILTVRFSAGVLSRSRIEVGEPLRRIRGRR